MDVVQLRREHAEELLRALRNGEAIPAPPDGWNPLEMMAVAAAMYHELRSRGQESIWLSDPADWEALFWEALAEQRPTRNTK
jgi:hypothetical protein